MLFPSALSAAHMLFRGLGGCQFTAMSPEFRLPLSPELLLNSGRNIVRQNESKDNQAETGLLNWMNFVSEYFHRS